MPAAGPDTWHRLDDLHARQSAALMTTACPQSGRREGYDPHRPQHMQVSVAASISYMPGNPLRTRCYRWALAASRDFVAALDVAAP